MADHNGNELKPRGSSAHTVESADIQEAYGTTDLDLAAFMMTVRGENNLPLATMAGIFPFRRSGANPGHGNRFQFALTPTPPATIETLRKVEMDYTNRQGSVEPLDFMATRRQLRFTLERHFTQELQQRNERAPQPPPQSQQTQKPNQRRIFNAPRITPPRDAR